MKSLSHRPCLRGFAACLVLFLLPLLLPAQEEESLDPYEWVVETYSFPASPLVGGFASEERGALKPPPLPGAGATDEEIQDFIRKNSSVVTHFLEIQGISLPKGALVLFDAESLTLTARLPRIAQSSVAFTSDSYLANITQFIDLRPLVIEAPAAVMREKLDAIRGTAEHTEILEELEALAEQGEATFVTRTRIEGRSGQRSKIEQVRQTASPVSLELGPDETVQFEGEFFDEGTVWEVDSVIGADEETIDLNISLHHHYAPGRRVQKPLTSTGEVTVTTSHTESNLATITSQYTLLAGSTRLLGVWKPEHEGGDGEQRDVLQAAFVSADLVRVLPLTTPRLAELLEEHGEAVLPTPDGAPEFEKAAEEIPEGMIVRRYRIPPTFLSSAGRGAGGGGAAADPFAAPVESEPTFTIQATARDILQSIGIPFPEGSSANYIRQNSTLVVRNTPENIQLVEAYIMSIRSGVEKSISIVAHVVQGPGALIREADRNTRGLVDHRAEWDRLQGIEDFSILTTQWIEARSGQRARVDAGWEFSYPASASVLPGAAPKDGENEQGAAGSTTTLGGDYEMERIGTSLEVDPVLGADSRTVDLNFAIDFDYGLPTIAGEAARAEGAIGLEGPSTTFHRANVTTSVTTLSGMIRMVGIWRPEGTPEFDNADVLQAVFLEANVIPLKPEEE